MGIRILGEKMNYCAVKEGKAYEGTKTEILSQILVIGFDDKQRLTLKVEGFELEVYHSYSNEWSKPEIYRDSINFAFKVLPSFGFKIYIET